jgi:lipid-A-disaccharide synthase
MIAEGCQSFFAQDRLAVMGLIEPLKRLPELLRIRRFLRDHFLANPPDVFIGIDSPDFNLSLEQSLHERYQNCALRQSFGVGVAARAFEKNCASLDLVLTLFPFEEKFYQDHSAAIHYCVRFV